MPIRASVYIATSLDGFIARENGDIDWLDAANEQVSPDTDMGFDAFMASVDALVMGRNTFEKVCGFGFWPYDDKPVIVMSSRSLALPEHVPAEHVVHSDEAPGALCQRLAGEGMQRLYVDGGALIQSFLAEGLVTDLCITTIPVLIGKGLPLFGAVPGDIRLEHVATRTFPGGLVQSDYRVIAPPA